MGKIIYGTHIEVPAPFDAKSCDAMDTRLVVESKADLTTNAMTTFNGTGRYCFVYEGIQVYVRNERSTYMYVGPHDGKMVFYYLRFKRKKIGESCRIRLQPQVNWVIRFRKYSPM